MAPTGLRDRERDSSVRTALRAAGLKGILAWYPEDTLMLGGTWSCLGLAVILYPAEAEPVFYAGQPEPGDVLPPGFLHRRFAVERGAWRDLAGKLAADLDRLGIGPGELGVVEDTGQHAVPSFPGESPMLTERAMLALLSARPPRDATPLFAGLAQRKTSREAQAIRTANLAARAGLEAFRAALAPGVTQAEVAARVEAAVQGFSGTAGSRLARAWAHVQAGQDIYESGTFSRSSPRLLADGDMVLLELGTCVDGYWSDLTRTAGVGRLGAAQAGLLAAVKAAQRAAIAAARPGVAHHEVDAAARRHLDGAGMGAGFPAGSGHHVGFSYHDRGPAVCAGSAGPLVPGMVITVEPGVYGLQFGGGARVEDNLLVTADGVEVLSAPAGAEEEEA
jgi:Xaa-Pro aminopeptidase